VTMTTDGNEADNESPTHQIPQRRPGSVMGGGGAGGYSHSRHSALPSQAVRAGSRLAVHGGREEGERPKWRP
jgi:hypothetical protein